MENSQPTQKSNDPPKIVVLRWGHRPQRDVRLTTHVALTARALCASGFILSDVEDSHIEQTVRKITSHWGGTFQFEMGTPWKKAVHDWRANGGIVVHLTAYGENIQISDVLNRVKRINKNVLLLVGSQKVPGEFYSSDVSDFNVSIGNQPHSECSALAIFLDRFFDGKELSKDFEKAKIKIIPRERGKEIKIDDEFPLQK
jgi:tRNA (cytidine56-2'-O)-methyltransferase